MFDWRDMVVALAIALVTIGLLSSCATTAPKKERWEVPAGKFICDGYAQTACGLRLINCRTHMMQDFTCQQSATYHGQGDTFAPSVPADFAPEPP